jgi:hypothetical protein
MKAEATTYADPCAQVFGSAATLDHPFLPAPEG